MLNCQLNQLLVSFVSIDLSFRLQEHNQTNNDPRIRHLLIENLMKTGNNEEMLQAVRNYP